MLSNRILTTVYEKTFIISILQTRKQRLMRVWFLAQDESQSYESTSGLFKARVQTFYYTSYKERYTYNDPDLDVRNETRKN